MLHLTHIVLRFRPNHKCVEERERDHNLIRSHNVLVIELTPLSVLGDTCLVMPCQSCLAIDSTLLRLRLYALDPQEAWHSHTIRIAWMHAWAIAQYVRLSKKFTTTMGKAAWTLMNWIQYTPEFVYEYGKSWPHRNQPVRANLWQQVLAGLPGERRD